MSELILLSDLERRGLVELGRGEIISKIDIEACPGNYPVYSSSASGDGKFGEYGKYIFNEELVSWSIDGGGHFFYRPKHQFSVTNVSGYMRSKDARLNLKYLFYALTNQHKFLTFDYMTKAHPSVIRKLYKVPFPSLCVQEKVAEILSTIDAEIEQTEALIAKWQKIKAGMMQDLFTRGVTPDGRLRPTYAEVPQLYKDSPLGWIPKEWDFVTINDIAESIIDGPFGSNLKSEHYVAEPGIRVVRLQNIQEMYYNDEAPVYIANKHAEYLSRNTVLYGDILIAGLGDDTYPVGRACCYSNEFAPAINKADCFRLRCLTRRALNTFIMYYINSSAVKKQIARLVQGVTRQRINTGNMRNVFVAVPSLPEQEME